MRAAAAGMPTIVRVLRPAPRAGAVTIALLEPVQPLLRAASPLLRVASPLLRPARPMLRQPGQPRFLQVPHQAKGAGRE